MFLYSLSVFLQGLFTAMERMEKMCHVISVFVQEVIIFAAATLLAKSQRNVKEVLSGSCTLLDTELGGTQSIRGKHRINIVQKILGPFWEKRDLLIAGVQLQHLQEVKKLTEKL